MTAKVRLNFNSPITATSMGGARNDLDHYQQVTPLRDELPLRANGIVGCHIAQDHITVTYRTKATDEATVIKAVQAAVRAVADIDNLFPLRGEETPEALLSKPSTPIYALAAGVSFNADIFSVGTNTANSIMEKLAARLTEVDGAHDPYIDVRRLFVKGDPRQTTPEILRSHMEQVVKEILAERETKSYFPFSTTSEPTINYDVQVYKSRIVLD